jgi:hypothetical protein
MNFEKNRQFPGGAVVSIDEYIKMREEKLKTPEGGSQPPETLKRT